MFNIFLCKWWAVFSQPWPGMMRTIFNNHERFESTYFTQFPGYYCTGDGKPFENYSFNLFTIKMFNFAICRCSAR